MNVVHHALLTWMLWCIITIILTDCYNSYHDSQFRTQTSISDHSSWKETSWSSVLNHVAYFAMKGCDCFIHLACSRPAPHIMPFFCLCVCVLSGKNRVMDGWRYRLINISTAGWLIKAFIVLQTFAFLNSSWSVADCGASGPAFSYLKLPWGTEMLNVTVGSSCWLMGTQPY